MTLEEIIGRFRSVNDDAVDLVRGLDDDQWGRLATVEGWPVGVTARHIALGHREFVGWVESMLAGGPVHPGDVDAVNAENAARGIVADQAEVARMLSEDGDAVLALLTGLDGDDVQGDVEFSGQVMPRIALLGASVRHVDRHLGSIRATLGLPAEPRQGAS
jgi:DinB superfamily